MSDVLKRSLPLLRQELSLLRGPRPLSFSIFHRLSYSSLQVEPRTFVGNAFPTHSSTLPNVRGLVGSPVLAGTSADLDKAKEVLGTLIEDPGNVTKLRLYALFKQVIDTGIRKSCAA